MNDNKKKVQIKVNWKEWRIDKEMSNGDFGFDKGIQ